MAAVFNGPQSSQPSNGATTAKYLAAPSGACCLEGTIHQGKPRGSFISVAEVETYAVHPPAHKANGHIILYFADVWGMFTNGLLVMDAFADAGYLVLGLDYFRGDPVWKHRKDRNDTTTNPNFDYEAWKSKHIAFADQAVPRWVKQVQQQFGTCNTRYAAVGYCFGAPYVCNQLAGNLVSAGAFAHPAFLKEEHIQAVSKTDHTFPKDSRRRAQDMLEEGGQSYHLQLFSGVSHGFALRGNSDIPYERWVKKQSLQGIVSWFDFWLSR